MQGKIVVLTGASSGIGLETARGVAALGARMAMVCRSPERGEAARRALLRELPDAQLDLLVADLSSQRQIRCLADEIGHRYDRIDVLVNNAAAVYSRQTFSEDGIEMQLAVNHLAAYLLTRLLLDSLCRSGRGRVVNVASRAHFRGRIDFDDLHGSRSYFGPRAYNQSKLANVLFTYELARRTAGRGVTANCVHPGLVRTRFGNKHTLPHHGLLHSLLCLFGVAPAEGARTPIYLASSPDVEGVTGRYFANGRPAPSSEASRDRALAERLWRVSAELTHLPAE
ncbi:MAG TPA: SDR family oxidoreductase [Candidatus Binatia bacterium]|nr:SDR family oxidoreductase [Candidatus Binatia bacterium]